MYAVTIVAILICIGMAMARAFLGPSIYDRILAINSAGTCIVLFLSVLGFLMGRPDFLDIALTYALINFTGTIAILKFFKYGSLGVSDPAAPSKAKVE